MLDRLVPELVRIDDEIDAVAAGVVSARGSAARHALDERGDVLDDVGLVVTQAELDRLVTIEHGRATLGYVIAEQPEEVLAEARIVALDLVDREDKQVARGKLARGNVLRFCLLEPLRIQVRPAVGRPKRAPHAIAPDREHRMLGGQMEPVAGAARCDLHQLAPVPAAHDLGDLSLLAAIV